MIRTSPRAQSLCHSAGFTLVELVVTITITAIVVGFVAMFVTVPVDAYIDQAERAEISDATQLIVRSMEADFRSALPNSVRISNVGTRSIVEFLRVESLSFYRTAGELSSDASRELIFSPATDSAFSAFGPLPVPKSTDYLVVGNKGMGNGNNTLDAYRVGASSVILPGTSIQIAPGPNPLEQSITLTPAFRFASPDSHNRMFLISGPVSYVCNAAASARSLRRFDSYAITSGMPTTETSPQLLAGTNTLLAVGVSSCALRCIGGNPNICGPAIAIEFVVNRATASGNDSIKVFQQFPLDNIS